MTIETRYLCHYGEMHPELFLSPGNKWLGEDKPRPHELGLGPQKPEPRGPGPHTNWGHEKPC